MRRLTAVLFISALMATSAMAGRHLLRYEERGQVSADIFMDHGQEKMLFRALPLTGDRTPGPAVMRLDGVYVAEWKNPAYEAEFDLGACISSLKGDKDGKLVIDWLKANPEQRVDLRRLTVGIHTVEIYFASVDDRGRTDRNRTAAPATQFRVEEEALPAAAITAGGQPIDANQLAETTKQAYESGKKDGLEASEKNIKALQDKIDELVREINDLKLKGAAAPPRTTVRESSACVKIGWQETSRCYRFGANRTDDEKSLIKEIGSNVQDVDKCEPIVMRDKYVLIYLTSPTCFSVEVYSGHSTKTLTAVKASRGYERWLWIAAGEVEKFITTPQGGLSVTTYVSSYRREQ
ncbi:MAG TPA: hypothetical protein VMQ44_01830 [Candidatus Saccharimonadales bacterium]|nr:hypothetical protein [Candidatus Saccharimonadales bacterium]